MGNSQVENLINHINAIESNLDGIIYMPGIITMTIPKYAGQKNENGIITLDLNHEYQTAEDFIGAAYILTSFLSLCNYYVEQIDYHTREICGILKSQADQSTINSLYSNISGRFYLPDPEFEENLFDLTLTFLNNKRERFKEIYFSNHYAPNGIEYLKVIFGSIKDYWLVCESIQKYLDNLKKSMP